MTTAGHVKLGQLRAEGPGRGIFNVELRRFKKHRTWKYLALKTSAILIDNI